MNNDKVPSYIPAFEKRLSTLLEGMLSEEDTDSPRLNQCFGGIQTLAWVIQQFPANEGLKVKINVSFDMEGEKKIGK